MNWGAYAGHLAFFASMGLTLVCVVLFKALQSGTPDARRLRASRWATCLDSSCCSECMIIMMSC